MPAEIAGYVCLRRLIPMTAMPRKLRIIFETISTLIELLIFQTFRQDCFEIVDKKQIASPLLNKFTSKLDGR